MDRCKKDNKPCIFSKECFEPEEEKPMTNADVVEVVRCRDCAGFYADDKFCKVWEAFVREDDFCSYGKLKDGDG
jgi:hypothetical protein